MAIIGDAPLDDVHERNAELLAQVAALKHERRVMKEDRDYYRGEANRARFAIRRLESGGST